MDNITKVLFITQNDPIYVAEFWKEFCTLWQANRKSNLEIIALVSLQTLGKAKPHDLFKRVYGMYGFLGTTKLLTKLAFTKLQKRGLAHYAKQLNSEYIRSNSLESKDIMDLAINSDIVFSVAASLKFPKAFLDAPNKGCFNIHSGPLPKYQGMMPVFWQMKDGNKQIGITIHKMDETIDTGKVFKQESTDISECKTLDHAIRKTKRIGAHLVLDFLTDTTQDLVELDQEIDNTGTYFSFPKKEDVVSFKTRGLELI